MIKWIIKYVIGREVYRQYQENRTVIGELISFEKLGNLAWNIIFIVIIFSLSLQFSYRNDLKLSDIQTGDTLYLKPFKSYWKNEVPIYNWTIKEDPYRAKNDVNKIDTLFHYEYTYKIDTSNPINQVVGTTTGKNHKNEDGIYIGIKRDRKFKISNPIWEDFSFEEKDSYSKDEFVSIEDVRKSDTKKPETRWLYHFFAMIFAYFAFKKFIASLLRFFKSKIPVYDRVPVYKRDNRYKSGQRIVRYKTIIKDYRPMTEEELSIHKKQQFSRLLLSGIIIAISIGYLFIIYSI